MENDTYLEYLARDSSDVLNDSPTAVLWGLFELTATRLKWLHSSLNTSDL